MEKKVALITGASGTLGRAIAKKLANKYQLILHYRNNDRVIREMLREPELKDKVIGVIRYDFRSPAKGFIEKIKEMTGNLDVAILSASIYDETPLTKLEENKLQEMIKVNLISQIYLGKELGLWMGEKGGVIVYLVCLTPLKGHRIYEGLRPSIGYIASKAGLAASIKYLASFLPRSVRVVGIAPGWVMSPKLTDKLMDSVLKTVPAGRPALPDEVAEVVAFVLSRRASYITGTIIEVSGGL
jgi:NAD(P)-dependent dehydrogenase (short-subunit alcohol dehydrogenase family)